MSSIHSVGAAAAAGGGIPDPPTVQMAASYQLSEFLGIDEDVTVRNDGDLILTVFSTDSSQANAWVANADKGGDYSNLFEVRFTRNSGAFPSSGDSLSTWLTIVTDREWSFSTGSVYNYTLEIREIANTSNNDSTTLSNF